MEKTKLYCYVDENGQDTLGRIFVVSVVAVGKQRKALFQKAKRDGVLVEVKS